MKQMLRLFVRGTALAAGILLTLISFVFIIDLGRVDFDRDEFWGFVLFGLLGIPVIFVGLGMLTHESPSDRPRQLTSSSKV
jgi:hypothetical protein